MPVARTYERFTILSSDPRVKKVSAYPIPVAIKTAAATLNGQIVRLTLQGFLAEIAPSNLQPGDRFEVSFSIPVINTAVTEPGVMIKLYSQWGAQKNDQKGSSSEPAAPEKDQPAPAPNAPNLTLGSPSAEGRPVVHLIEVHFQSLGLNARAAVSQFVRATGKPV